MPWRNRSAVFSLAAIGWVALAGGAVGQEAGRESGRRDWPTFGADGAASRYSPLDQIDRDNFQQLEIAWRWESISGAVAAANPRVRPGEFKVIPIIVDGIVYVATEISQVAAIDAGTGDTVWSYDPESWKAGRPANIGWQHRGVAYWSDGEEARIFIATQDRRLLALDARTGEPSSEFGVGGEVDLFADRGAEHFGRQVNIRHITHSSPPAVIGNTVVVGSVVHDGATHKAAPPGWVRAFDARSGRLKWIFHTIPQQGELGNETWEDGSWRYSGATNVWSMMAVDEELGYIYLPVATPTNDMYGGHRLGDNLYAESIVCLEAETGKRVWHFQVVHHGLWDYDLASAPILADITVDGQAIRAVAQVSKQGFTYVFDRVTGKPVWPIEERPVPPSSVPGERASPTQPFPTRPAPFERQGTREEALIDLTPELAKEAREIAAGFTLGPLYTPPRRDVDGKPVLILPNPGGGANWQGAALDPETGILYIPSWSAPTAFSVATPDRARSDFDYVIKSWLTQTAGPQGLPLTKPPWGRVTAIDLNTGEHVWMTPNGHGPVSHPALAGVDLGMLGGGGGGPLLTKTLLFVNQVRGLGDENTPRLNVFDKAAGELLGHVPMPETPNGNPVTYLHEGRQYIVVAVGGGPFVSQDEGDWNDATSEQVRQVIRQTRATTPELIALRLP